jgi:hypothetical protein
MVSVVHELDDTISIDALFYVNSDFLGVFASLFVLSHNIRQHFIQFVFDLKRVSGK